MEVFDEILIQAGLTKIESEVYSTLLSNGTLTILELANKSKLKRTNLYNILEALEKKNLVKKITSGKSTKYTPNSPREIANQLDLKENQINVAKNTFELLIDGLQSQYNLLSNKPTITYYEGIKGLQRVYQDIIDEGKEICLFRSSHDDKRTDVDKIVQKQIVAQVKRGIKAKVIGPMEPEAKESYLKYDKFRLVEERFIHKFGFNLPAQIIIYGNKTAIATIRKDIVVTVIDNLDITQTFQLLFDFVWTYSTLEHNALVKSWK